jgi:hypothetical protein
MKKLSLFLLSVLVAASAMANDSAALTRMKQKAAAAQGAPTTAGVTVAKKSPEFAKAVLKKWLARDVKASVIIENRSDRGFLIPAAGSQPAGGGSLFFRSDITIVNNDDEPQDVAVIWIPIGGREPDAGVMTLPADEPPTTFVDFVGRELGITGLGSLAFIAIDDFGGVDEFSSIDGFSRIWTRQPGSTGTVSQPFPAINPDYLLFETDAFLLGLRQDPNFRTNYGIVNLDDTSAHTFTVTIFPERNGGSRGFIEFPVTVGPLGMTQAAIPAGDFGALTIVVSTDAGADDAPFSWTTYASTTDNITGDGWVTNATVLLHPEDLPPIGVQRKK